MKPDASNPSHDLKSREAQPRIAKRQVPKAGDSSDLHDFPALTEKSLRTPKGDPSIQLEAMEECPFPTIVTLTDVVKATTHEGLNVLQ